ncbi:MAG: hypothetical protein ACUVXA_03070 [Candidatus Jordarchaeum sp.]|uniref:hypothetical protein n=1 Tax=Candidatus Jordarchaeum sp. TaxID=2823881 RepID=UPI00404B05C8
MVAVYETIAKLASCYICQAKTENYCEDCGLPICSSHSTICKFCGKHLCLNCDY